MPKTLNHLRMFIGYQLWKEILPLAFLFPKYKAKQEQVNDINN